MTIGTSRVKWLPCWRIIPSRFPPIQLFERVVDPADLDAVMEIESMTNPRLRDEVGDIQLVPPEERISGPGTSIIMAAFTHLNPEGSRFSDGQFGVFYASDTLDTAIRETVYHRELFMQATSQPRMELDQRVYMVDLDTELHDIRGQRDSLPLLYHPSDYSASQHLARTLIKDGSSGIAYDSVRYEKGECVGIFRPKVLSNCRQERHLCYVWDGQKIGNVYEKRSLTCPSNAQ
jgi:hypothetical protein